MSSDRNKNVIDEALRIEEDCEHSAKRHFNASGRWETYNLWLGIPTAILTAIASVSAFNEYPNFAGYLALIASALTAVLTFLKPSERSQKHQTVGNQYLALRNKTRLFRTLSADNSEKAVSTLKEFSELRDELNQTPLKTIREDYEVAKKDIDEGRAKYQVDGEKNDNK